jgi:lipopolysaccharide transport system ATP-binding protein
MRAIFVDKLGKQYHIGGQQRTYKTLRDSLAGAVSEPFRRLRSVGQGGAASSAKETFWALKDLSLEIQAGEVVGIIGPNGAGKSTFLKILSRITEPTEGYVEIRSPVGSLLEVGTGFHPELTGRENIYLNGAILGMRRAEIDRKFDEIVAFSGVEKFIDTPVKHYSSGMGVRLAFSVAAHLEPEVLLVDEVLAVGDAAFQKKCLGKMGDVASSGRTVLLVSHNMEAVLGLCSRAIWISGGRVQEDGAAGQVVRNYMASAVERIGTVSLAERKDRTGGGQMRFIEFSLQDASGNAVNAIPTGDPANLVASYVTQGEPVRDVRVWFNIRDSYGRLLMCFYTSAVGGDFVTLPPTGQIVCHVPRIPLVPGVYSVDIHSRVNHKISADNIASAATIEVLPGDFFGMGVPLRDMGEFLVDHSWALREVTAERS